MYRIEVDPDAVREIGELPAVALAPLAAVYAALEVAPWNGAPFQQSNPAGNMRLWRFGPPGRGTLRGAVVYVVHDEDRLVRVVRITWLSS